MGTGSDDIGGQAERASVLELDEPIDHATARHSPVAWTDNLEELYRAWHRRVAAAQEGHHQVGDALGKRNVLLGLPVVILSTIVGTSAFASLADENVGSWVKVFVGTIGVLAAALSAMQTFFGFAQRSEGHRIAAVRYETLRRSMAQQLSMSRRARGDAAVEMTRARMRMDKYAKESPALPEAVWHAMCRRFEIPETPPPVE